MTKPFLSLARDYDSNPMPGSPAKHGVPYMTTMLGLYKEGGSGLYERRKLAQWFAYNWRTLMAEKAKEDADALEVATKVVEEFSGRLFSASREARTKIDGELASIKAMVDRGSKNLQMMRSQVGETIELWTSPEMEKAIANAERMAEAMRQLAELNSAQITFATIGKVGQ